MSIRDRSWEVRNGLTYKSPIVPWAEIVMILVPRDPPGLRKKLDTQWFKGCWVGRQEKNDAHIVLTPHGIIVGKAIRRLSPEARYDAEIFNKLKGSVNDAVLSQAKLLKLMSLSIPIRRTGEDEKKEEKKADAEEAKQEYAPALTDADLTGAALTGGEN